jgi:hypothetical protein
MPAALALEASVCGQPLLQAAGLQGSRKDLVQLQRPRFHRIVRTAAQLFGQASQLLQLGCGALQRTWDERLQRQQGKLFFGRQGFVV